MAYSPLGDAETEEMETAPLILDVLWAGEVYNYCIPSFNVITVALRHIEISLRDGTKFDAFIKNTEFFGIPIPTTIMVTESCNVDVSF